MKNLLIPSGKLWRNFCQSPTSKDIVTFQQYDQFSREPKVFIPYTATSNNGAYRTDAATAQAAFATSWGAGGYGYAEKRFESSPLNRVVEEAAPGATWRIGQGKTQEYLYRGNTATEAIRDFTNSLNFADNALFVTEELDENERKKLTYSDKLGRVVMVRQQLANAPTTEDLHWARTYTVYDDFGRIAAVIPPEAAKKMKVDNNWNWSQSTYASMIFSYVYDSRGRLTSKTVPSGGTTTTAYDRLDRPVLTTDAKGFKQFTRYDILSRPVVSGKYNGTAVPANSDNLFVSPNTTSPHFYSTNAYPIDNNINVYQVNYFDDYDLDNNGTLATTESYTNPAETPFETAAFAQIRGKQTASKTGILQTNGSAPASFLLTRTYYDKEYSIIQINKGNHLSGSDITSTAYDFANRPVKVRRDHTATPPGGTVRNLTIREEYVYDHAGRLRYTVHQIGAQKKEIIAAVNYDELGRVAEKNLHASNFTGSPLPPVSSTYNYLQSVDFSYNIRGWLTGMNTFTGSCAAEAGDNLADLFALGLDYDNTANGASPQYNGNIAAMQWRTLVGTTCGSMNQYRFSYDANNRLINANHYTFTTSWVFTNRYTESNISYDLNGNLKTYTRRGFLSAPSTYGAIDQLTYTYGDPARPDRLTQVSDAGNAAKGFVFTAGAGVYAYDLNGNLTTDNHKGFNFAYNHLNLPQTIVKGSNTITLTYTASGEKLSKSVTGGNTKNYISGIEYNGAALEAIYHSEGRCTPDGSNFFYEYTLKDHLGNARVNFRANGTAVSNVEDMHYYPFGMQMEGTGSATPSNKYLYNGKERNDDLGLNWYDYGARWYDAALGRWWSVDPVSDMYEGISPYCYSLNNPVTFLDPNGMWVIFSGSQEQKNLLTNTLNNYIGIQGVFSINEGGLLTVNTLSSEQKQSLSAAQLGFYNEAKFQATTTQLVTDYQLVTEGSLPNESGGETVNFDSYDYSQLDVEDLSMAGEDVGNLFTHALYEQSIKDNQGKFQFLKIWPQDDGVEYDEAHGHTMKNDIKRTGYTFNNEYAAVVNNQFKVVRDAVDGKGKVVKSVMITYKSKENKTVVSYERFDRYSNEGKGYLERNGFTRFD